MEAVISAGFGVRKTYKGQKDFDTTYKDIKLVKELVPLGPADDHGHIPYTEEVREVVTETPIKEVIARSEGDCGLEAFLRPYQATGTEPPEVVIDPSINDFTQFDGTPDLRASGEVERLFNSLPADLQAAYGSPEGLLQRMTQKDFNDYINRHIKKPEDKPDDIKDGDN